MNKKTLLFILAVFLQLIILFMIPVPRWMALLFGKTVFLETAPVDPYNIFSGYYVRLAFQISNPSDLGLENKPTNFIDGKYYYMIVSPDQQQIWRPIKVATKMPKRLKRKQIALKGRYRNGLINYGIEQYYIPENQRRIMADLLSNREERAVVEVKVARSGQPAIVKIEVAGQIFKY